MIASGERGNVRSVDGHYHSCLAVCGFCLCAVEPDGVCVVYCYGEGALIDKEQMRLAC